MRESDDVRDGPRGWAVVVILAVVIGAVYVRGLQAPFLMDDEISIIKNPSIVSLWPLIGTTEQPGPLAPPADLPTSARPLVNYSFALNYHWGGLNPVGYHVVNVVIHFLTACLLWAVVRRTLRLEYFEGRFAADAGWVALAVALLWGVHPLQTEAVIYSTQRTELMMALFYLATLYCSLRYWEPPAEPATADLRPGAGGRRGVWVWLATLACACGMASKEVMVSAPVVVLLFERAFVAGSLGAAIRRSWPLYVGLFATWIVLLGLNLGAPRSGSTGFHFDVPAYAWWLTQCEVLLMYLKLAVWPAPLLCHYQLPYLMSFGEAWPYVLPVLALAVVTMVLLWRNAAAGFLLTFAAAVLAPTFVVPILTEMAAERRMYLPLAPLLALVFVGAYWLMFKSQPQSGGVNAPGETAARPGAIAFGFAMLLTLVAGVASASRLGDYYDEMRMWRQVEEAEPQNYIAHYNMGLLLNHAGRDEESFAELEKSLAANPNYPNARSAMGFALIHAGRLPEAIASLNAALAIDSEHVGALNNLGLALMAEGQNDQAIDALQHALRVDPSHADARNNLGKALTAAGRAAEAQQVLQSGQGTGPDDPDALNSLAGSLAAQGQLPEAIKLYERALELRPDFAAAHNALGIAQFNSGDIPHAIEHFRRFMESNPQNPGAYCNLANVIAAQGDFQQAATLFEQAVKLQPNSAEAQYSLGTALVKLGRGPEAIERFQTALKLKPGVLVIYPNLADALVGAGRVAEARDVAKQGVDAAKAAGNEAFAGQMEEWLGKH